MMFHQAKLYPKLNPILSFFFLTPPSIYIWISIYLHLNIYLSAPEYISIYISQYLSTYSWVYIYFYLFIYLWRNPYILYIKQSIKRFMCEYMLHIAGITYRRNTRDVRFIQLFRKIWIGSFLDLSVIFHLLRSFYRRTIVQLNRSFLSNFR